MTTIVNFATLACTPEQLYAYVTLPWRWHEWHPTSQGASRARGELAVGEQFDEEIEVRPLAPLPLRFRRALHYRVLVAEPPTRWEVEGRGTDNRVRIRYDFSASVGGVDFKRTLDYTISGPIRLLAPILHRSNRRVSAIALTNLERIMAGGPSEPQDD